jgi:hypothetical protein
MRKLTNKKEEPESPEDAPDVPWTIYKPTVLPDEPGLQRVAWNLYAKGPKTIPHAKNDAGTPHEGPMVLPGTYTLKLHVDGTVLESRVLVRLDPRVNISKEELEKRQELAATIEGDISKLSEIVIALRSVRDQIKERCKLESKGSKWVKEADAVLPKLDALEEKLHNPKAEVSYDILAQKGGAKLYSQLTPLYYDLMGSDAAVTQGVREVYAEHARELRRLEDEWQALVRGDIARLNERARDLPAIVVPAAKDKE